MTTNEYPTWCVTTDAKERWDRMTPAQRAFKLRESSFAKGSTLKKARHEAHKIRSRKHQKELRADPVYNAVILERLRNKMKKQ